MEDIGRGLLPLWHYILVRFLAIGQEDGVVRHNRFEVSHLRKGHAYPSQNGETKALRDAPTSQERFRETGGGAAPLRLPFECSPLHDKRSERKNGTASHGSPGSRRCYHSWLQIIHRSKRCLACGVSRGLCAPVMSRRDHHHFVKVQMGCFGRVRCMSRRGTREEQRAKCSLPATGDAIGGISGVAFACLIPHTCRRIAPCDSW